MATSDSRRRLSRPTDTPASRQRSAGDGPRALDNPRLHTQVSDDAFFRHIVAGMRNGVLAITRAGAIALMNEEAYRIFGIEPQPHGLGAAVRRGASHDNPRWCGS